MEGTASAPYGATSRSHRWHDRHSCGAPSSRRDEGSTSMRLTTSSTPFSRLTARSALRLTLSFTTCPDRVTVVPCTSILSVSNTPWSGRSASLSWIVHSTSSSVLPAHLCYCAVAESAANSSTHAILEILSSRLVFIASASCFKLARRGVLKRRGRPSRTVGHSPFQATVRDGKPPPAFEFRNWTACRNCASRRSVVEARWLPIVFQGPEKARRTKQIEHRAMDKHLQDTAARHGG
jgi:hypothetical protein